MKIKKIKIKNFKSIYDETELDFDEIKGFWKISGSVGSGKTTIGEAIIFGLFGSINGKNNGDLISWGQKSGCIEIWCNSKGNDIYIKRDIKLHGQSPIYVEINGDELIFTNKKDAQKQLEVEYYDTSRMVLELLCIISFNNFKSLASLNTSDTKKFLDQVLGFYILTEYADICKQLKKENQDNINDIQNDINIKKFQINKLKEISSKTYIEGNINEVKSIIDKNKQKTQEILQKHSKIREELLSKQRELNNEKNTVMIMGKNKAKEIDFIKKGICPTCGAKIDNSNLDNIIEEKRVLGEQYKHIQNLINKCTDEYNTNNKNELDSITPVENIIRENYGLLAQLEEQSKRESINAKDIERLEQEVENLNDKYNNYTLDDNMWSDLYGILSNEIRYKILESFIPVLNDNISKYTQLLQLPYNINFNGEFKCNIELCGLNNNVPISSLSTGQLKIVDMIIILGVLGTILGNNSTNIIFLDELFSNLDADLRENMCRILKMTMMDDKTIFIISHQEINGQIFDGNLNLKLENCNSFIKKTKIDIN